MDTRQEEVTTLDPELEEALSSATDTELCDLAGKSAGEHFGLEGGGLRISRVYTNSPEERYLV